MKKFRTITVKEENGVEHIALVEAKSKNTGTSTDVSCTITGVFKIPQELFFLYGTDEVVIDMPLTQETLEKAKLYYEYFQKSTPKNWKFMHLSYNKGRMKGKGIPQSQEVKAAWARQATFYKLTQEGRAILQTL